MILEGAVHTLYEVLGSTDIFTSINIQGDIT